MFKKTLIKLTVLNSAILILLIGLLGGAIYYYEKTITFRNVNQLLKHAVVTLPLNPRGEPSPGGPGMHDRLYVAVLNSGNKVLRPDMSILNSKTIKPFLTKTMDTVVEKKVEGDYYHLIATKIKTVQGTFTVYYIVNVEPEKNLLNTLLSIILYGTGIGAVLSVVMGYFLARWALRPIEVSWEKQRRFVADASHELRTPLSIIQLKMEGLLKKPHGRIQDAGADISTVLGETRRLSKLVANLLTLARSDANRLEINHEIVSVSDVLKQVAEPFQEMAVYHEKTLMVNIENKPMIIVGDKGRIHQLLVILLDNAMKFTDKGGRITVACGIENHMVRITVSDNGIGIKEEDLPHIFDRFYQTDTSRTDREGTGLGLAIGKWIVERHKGRITVQSKVNEGTCFTVLLPLARSKSGQTET